MARRAAVAEESSEGSIFVSFRLDDVMRCRNEDEGGEEETELLDGPSWFECEVSSLVLDSREFGSIIESCNNV